MANKTFRFNEEDMERMFKLKEKYPKLKADIDILRFCFDNALDGVKEVKKEMSDYSQKVWESFVEDKDQFCLNHTTRLVSDCDCFENGDLKKEIIRRTG